MRNEIKTEGNFKKTVEENAPKPASQNSMHNDEMLLSITALHRNRLI